MNHYLILISIITGLGLLGGFINYFRFRTADSDLTFTLGKSLLTGLGASALVPLFLNMMSSDLMSSSETNNLDYFIIGGFCLISSIFSTRFIDTLADKIIQDIKNDVNKNIEQVSMDVKEVKNELEEVTTENDFDAISDSKNRYTVLDENEKRILLSMYGSKYTYRSLSGISVETGLKRDLLPPVLERLQVNGYLRQHTRRNGTQRWKLTELGRDTISESYGDEESY